jgi:hypothetical protein
MSTWFSVNWFIVLVGAVFATGVVGLIRNSFLNARSKRFRARIERFRGMVRYRSMPNQGIVGFTYSWWEPVAWLGTEGGLKCVMVSTLISTSFRDVADQVVRALGHETHVDAVDLAWARDQIFVRRLDLYLPDPDLLGIGWSEREVAPNAWVICHRNSPEQVANSIIVECNGRMRQQARF